MYCKDNWKWFFSYALLLFIFFLADGNGHSVQKQAKFSGVSNKGVLVAIHFGENC